jgi:hypothetical protein
MRWFVESEFVQDRAEILLLVKVDSAVSAVSNDSYAEDLANLPQRLGLESL